MLLSGKELAEKHGMVAIYELGACWKLFFSPSEFVFPLEALALLNVADQNLAQCCRDFADQGLKTLANFNVVMTF